MVLVKLLMKISPPTMRGSLVFSMAMISPSRREVPPAESLRRRAKVLLPKFRLETAAHHPESILSNYFRSKSLIYQKMGARSGPGPPRGTRARMGRGWRALVRHGHLGAPLWYFLLPIFFIYSKIILQKISAHLEFCRIGILTELFQVQNSSCRYSPSLCESCILREKGH
jgi:hypothetical protein